MTPCDSVAVIASNYKLLPYLAKAGLAGLSRSMPTAAVCNVTRNVRSFYCATTAAFVNGTNCPRGRSLAVAAYAFPLNLRSFWAVYTGVQALDQVAKKLGVEFFEVSSVAM